MGFSSPSPESTRCIVGGAFLGTLLRRSCQGIIPGLLGSRPPPPWRVQVWAGCFSFCSDRQDAQERGEEVYYVYADGADGLGTREQCEAVQGYQWITPPWSFDSFGKALYSVVIIFTLDGWHEIAFSAMNARLSPPGLNAVAWNNTWASLYFLCVVLSSIVLMLLLVGVVFSMYSYLNVTERGERLTSLKQVRKGITRGGPRVPVERRY